MIGRINGADSGSDSSNDHASDDGGVQSGAGVCMFDAGMHAIADGSVFDRLHMQLGIIDKDHVLYHGDRKLGRIKFLHGAVFSVKAFFCEGPS